MNVANHLWLKVKSECSISDYLDSRHIHYQRRGNRLRLKCPFPTHADSTPSFVVYKDDNYHCFGCSSDAGSRHYYNGDIFTLRSALENITKVEAYARFALEKGIEVDDPQIQLLEKSLEEDKKNKELLDRYVQDLGTKSDWLRYLTEDRGLSEETIIHFGLGYDVTKDCLMIPLYDEHYRILDFVEHYLSGKEKYRVPPDSDILVNKNFLFNLGSLKNYLELPEHCFVVEGYFDAMSLWDKGHKTVVAFRGSRINEHHAGKIKAHLHRDTRLVFVPDLDSTGLTSVELNFRALRKVVHNPCSVVPLLPEVDGIKIKDVNDWFAKGKQETLPEMVRYYDYIVMYHLARCPNDKDIQLDRIHQALRFANPLEKEMSIQSIAKFFNYPESQIRSFIGLNAEVIAEFTNFFTTSDRIDGYIDYIDNLDTVRLSTGWKEIDETIRGINPGEVLGIMGRANTCKTLMATDMFHKQVQLGRDVPTIFFSLEMSRNQIQERMLLQALGIQPVDQRSSGTVLEMLIRNRDVQTMDLIESMKVLHQNFIVVDQPNLSVQDIDRYIDLISSTQFGRPVEQVIVDHLHIVKSYGDSYSKTSNAIKDFRNMIKAKSTCSGVILIQTSRKGGSGGDPITMDDARDSGQIEETLDFLLGVWRPELKAQAEIEKIKAEPMQMVPKAKKSGTTSLKKADGTQLYETQDEIYERTRREKSRRILLCERGIEDQKGIVNVKLLKSRREGRDSIWVYKMDGISLKFIKKGHMYQSEFSDTDIKNPFEDGK